MRVRLYRTRRRRRWLIVAVAAALLLIAGLVAWPSLRSRSPAAPAGDGPPAATGTAAPTPTAGDDTSGTGTGTGTGAATPGSGAPGSGAPGTGAPGTGPVVRSTSGPAGPGPRPPLPAGWFLYRDPTGFSLYVPKGWTRSQKGSIVYFRGNGRTLGIDQTDRPKWDPVADWRGQADYRVARGDFPGYREIGIRKVAYWRVAADWEYTFNGDSSRRHVNNRGFVVSQNQAYGIYWQTSDSAWQSARRDLQLIFDSFRPATD